MLIDYNETASKNSNNKNNKTNINNQSTHKRNRNPSRGKRGWLFFLYIICSMLIRLRIFLWRTLGFFFFSSRCYCCWLCVCVSEYLCCSLIGNFALELFAEFISFVNLIWIYSNEDIFNWMLLDARLATRGLRFDSGHCLHSTEFDSTFVTVSENWCCN